MSIAGGRSAVKKTTSTQAEVVFKEISKFAAEDITKTPTPELEKILYPLGMGKIKAEQLKEMAVKAQDADIEQMKSDEFLRSMCGVGCYISNSVRCIAFGLPASALDTNMIRIIERVFGWYWERARAREDKKLCSLLKHLYLKIPVVNIIGGFWILEWPFAHSGLQNVISVHCKKFVIIIKS